MRNRINLMGYERPSGKVVVKSNRPHIAAGVDSNKIVIGIPVQTTKGEGHVKLQKKIVYP